jgi:hypothetical protein
MKSGIAIRLSQRRRSRPQGQTADFFNSLLLIECDTPHPQLAMQGVQMFDAVPDSSD